LIIDLRELESGGVIEAELCIVGGGPAGICLARAFAGSGVEVALLESGGWIAESAIQALSGGQNAGLPYYPLESTRLRFFGGAGNHWSGWSTPLDESDFEPRPWVPHSGWPIRLADLEPYLHEAQGLCELGRYDYDATHWEGDERRFPALRPDKLALCFWQFSPPTRFAQRYREDLERARNVRTYLHANVAELEAHPDGRAVTRAHIRGPDGFEGSVRARTFVLACGAIENARLLLLSNGVEPAGLGNRHDLVGRFFMEHANIDDAGRVIATDPAALAELFTRYEAEGLWVRAGLAPSRAAQQREQILNLSAVVTGRREEDSGFHALTRLYRALRNLHWPDDLSSELRRVIGDLDAVAEGLAQTARGRPYALPWTSEISVHTAIEQAPNPDSRVRLGDERDALGQRRVVLDWRLTELDRHTFLTALGLIGEEFGRLELGRLQIHEALRSDDGGWPEQLEGSFHHMGTTRMADDPRHGVIDRNCRVHGIENLYVAGSSAFATAGHANPTLSLIALTLRLADHLKGRRGPG
jgi:choline dehydrogenase-like flavoprotein